MNDKINAKLIVGNREFAVQHMKWKTRETILGPASYREWTIETPLAPTAYRREVDIERVIFNPPATIVLWHDGTKTVVKCGEGDTYSKEVGLAMCIAKKSYGNKGNYNNVFRRWIE